MFGLLVYNNLTQIANSVKSQPKYHFAYNTYIFLTFNPLVVVSAFICLCYCCQIIGGKAIHYMREDTLMNMKLNVAKITQKHY